MLGSGHKLGPSITQGGRGFLSRSLSSLWTFNPKNPDSVASFNPLTIFMVKKLFLESNLSLGYASSALPRSTPAAEAEHGGRHHPDSTVAKFSNFSTKGTLRGEDAGRFPSGRSRPVQAPQAQMPCVLFFSKIHARMKSYAVIYTCVQFFSCKISQFRSAVPEASGTLHGPRGSGRLPRKSRVLTAPHLVTDTPGVFP